MPKRNENLYNEVVGFVAEQLGVDKTEIKPESNFIEDLGADSLDLPELVLDIEDEFSINIPDEIAQKIITVNDLYLAIENILQEERQKEQDNKNSVIAHRTAKKNTTAITWLDAKKILAKNFRCKVDDLDLEATFLHLHVKEGMIACAILDLKHQFDIKDNAPGFRSWTRVIDIKKWSGL